MNKGIATYDKPYKIFDCGDVYRNMPVNFRADDCFRLLYFFISLRSMSYRQIETNTSKIIENVRDIVASKFETWANLMRHTAVGAAPLMSQEPVDTLAIHNFFIRMI